MSISEPGLLGKTLLQRIILPRPGEPLDVRTLYLEESPTNARRAHATTRTTLTVGAESEVSLCTYFNAFPASYWRRWSTLPAVVLRLELTGHGRVDIYRSKADASRIHVTGSEFSGDKVVVEFETDLGPFEDGGWIWFDITTDTEVDAALRGLVLAGGGRRPRVRRCRYPDVQPARRLCEGTAGARVRPAGHRRRRRRDHSGPGHPQGS